MDGISVQSYDATLVLCVRKSEEQLEFNGVFTDGGMKGMLQATDIEN